MGWSDRIRRGGTSDGESEAAEYDAPTEAEAGVDEVPAWLRTALRRDVTGPRTVMSAIAADGEPVAARANGQDWVVAWHPPPEPPAGRRHGAEGICVTPDGQIVLISRDGDRWELPAGRPDGDETWEETLRREVLEEACATVVRARLLGFTRGVCVAGHEQGLVLVRSMWRADVELARWDPRFEISHRRVVPAARLSAEVRLATLPFAPIVRRMIHEASVIQPPGQQKP
ncbi:NUDIX hydrolase [Jiangella asiatica]|uniref:NUDIX hydrolase n=1 Tax=Jiangella asiatica TaxID=2530372 RepID=A0A4R5DGX5_9ACTN|nr:NUDIX hydrolase [Jiangella asiatica]TDE13069.1 NUDIX hydrolase [Jiangella asiatica]